MVSKSVEREMSYLMKLKEEREEERYRQLDAAIRAHQKGRGLAAAKHQRKQRQRKKKRQRKDFCCFAEKKDLLCRKRKNE